MTDADLDATIADVRELAHSLRRVKTAAEIPPRLLDLADAARYLSMGDKALRALIQRGELPYVQSIAGRSPYLLDVRDLDKWVERSKIHSPSG
jgi:excisionase family DNA binding protein